MKFLWKKFGQFEGKIWLAHWLLRVPTARRVPASVVSPCGDASLGILGDCESMQSSHGSLCSASQFQEFFFSSMKAPLLVHTGAFIGLNAMQNGQVEAEIFSNLQDLNPGLPPYFVLTESLSHRFMMMCSKTVNKLSNFAKSNPFCMLDSQF